MLVQTNHGPFLIYSFYYGARKARKFMFMWVFMRVLVYHQLKNPPRTSLNRLKLQHFGGINYFTSPFFKFIKIIIDKSIENNKPVTLKRYERIKRLVFFFFETVKNIHNLQ